MANIFTKAAMAMTQAFRDAPHVDPSDLDLDDLGELGEELEEMPEAEQMKAIKQIQQIGMPEGIVPGSPEAKLWWKEVQATAQSAATPTMKAKYGDILTGMYRGKPLRPGPHPGDGDFQFMVDGLIVTQGLTPAQASSIAAKGLNTRFPGWRGRM